MRAGRAAWWTAALAVVAVLMAATTIGCTGKSGSHSEQPSSTSDARSTTTLDRRSLAVVDDYKAFWVALLEASNPPNPDSQALAAHVTGEEKERTAVVLESRRRAGESVRGTYEHSATVVSVGESRAKVNDCLVAHTQVFDEKGAEKLRDPEQAQPIAVTLEREGGTWKVALIKPWPNGDCERIIRETTTSKPS